MTKLEQLKDKVLHWNRYSDVPHVPEEIVDSLISAAKEELRLTLISAAHAEGVAEERKRLMSLLALLVMYEGVVPASVIAIKESETAYYAVGDNGESGERHT
jgi:hypothetical protein